VIRRSESRSPASSFAAPGRCAPRSSHRPAGASTPGASFDDPSATWSSALALGHLTWPPPEVRVLRPIAPVSRIARGVPFPNRRPQERPLECRAAGGGVRGRYRRASRCPPTPPVVFQRLLWETPTPSRSKEARYLQGTRFESIAERKPRPRLLTWDGNVEVTGQDLR
jgi:hypothetical protein